MGEKLKKRKSPQRFLLGPVHHRPQQRGLLILPLLENISGTGYHKGSTTHKGLSQHQSNDMP